MEVIGGVVVKIGGAILVKVGWGGDRKTVRPEHYTTAYYCSQPC